MRDILSRRRWRLAASAAVLSSLSAPGWAQEAGDPIREIVLWSRTQAANPQAYQAAQLIAQAWGRLGLDVEVRGDRKSVV